MESGEVSGEVEVEDIEKCNLISTHGEVISQWSNMGDTHSEEVEEEKLLEVEVEEEEGDIGGDNYQQQAILGGSRGPMLMQQFNHRFGNLDENIITVPANKYIYIYILLSIRMISKSYIESDSIIQDNPDFFQNLANLYDNRVSFAKQ